MRRVKRGILEVARLALGGHPFRGFSHQGPERDRERIRFYTVANIKQALRKAEAAGINTLFAETARHIRRLLREYWNEGGKIQGVGQTARELADQVRVVRDAMADGSRAVYIHDGLADVLFAQSRLDELRTLLHAIHDAGVPAELAGHSVETHRGIRDHLEPDFHFQMCSHYDPSPRTKSLHHVSAPAEKWDDRHRDAMVELIRTVPCPVVHDKVLAGGKKPAREAFECLASRLRPQEIACVGHSMGRNPDRIEQNVCTFETVVETRAGAYTDRSGCRAG